MEVKVEPAKAPGGPPVPGSTIAATARPVLLVPRAARAPAPGVPKAGGSPAPGDTNFGPEINARAQPAWQRPPTFAFLGGRSRVREIQLVSYGRQEDALQIPANWCVFNVEHMRDPSSSDYFHICFKICLFLFSIYLVLILSFKNLARLALCPRWPALADPGPPHCQEVPVPGASAEAEAVRR